MEISIGEGIVFCNYFFGLTSIITIPLVLIYGEFLWQGFVFTIPVYLALGGFVILGTMVGNHSLGGLIAGILFG